MTLRDEQLRDDQLTGGPMTRTASPQRRRSLVSGVCCAIVATSMFAASPARAEDEDADSRPDARLMGYPTNGNTPELALGSSTTTSYLATILLGTLAVAILFKGTGRTHLD